MGLAALDSVDHDSSNTGKKKVLIVDDEQGIIKFLSKALEISGYEVVTASAADEAMQLVLSENVDILLTDIKMPGGSGFDLMSLTRLAENGIPIVLMSGHIDISVMAEKGIEAGAVQCLNKPFTIQELRDTIKTAFKNGPAKLADEEEENSGT